MVTAPETVRFSFDDEPTVNSQDELKRAVTSGEQKSAWYSTGTYPYYGLHLERGTAVRLKVSWQP